MLTNNVIIIAQDSDTQCSDLDLNPLQNYQSPSTATFNTYGSIPVSLYTGTPEISIPLYTIKEDGIEIPIELKYNINNVKPNTHPGEVGLGWNLFAGGSITRIIKGGEYDEKSQKNLVSDLGFLGFLGKESRLADNWWNSDACYSTSNNYSWYSLSRLNLEATLLPADYYKERQRDLGPDKFIFNFLGYSGSFYRNHAGEWIVDSTTPFKVQHSIMKFGDTRVSQTLTYKINEYRIDRTETLKENTLEKFILTAPNGLVFEFGGIDAIDYNQDLYSLNDPNSIPIATTWHLTKIILNNGKEYNFQYIPSDPILEGSYSFWIQSNFEDNANGAPGRSLSFQLIEPVLLRRIMSPYSEKIVEFEYENSTELKYPQYYFTYEGWYPITLWSSPIYYDSNYVRHLRETIWKKLTIMRIIDGTEYNFKYTISLAERLKLLSLTKNITGKNTVIENTNFSYYTDVKLPDYLSGHYDHLGFYNGADFSFTFKRPFFFNKWNFVNNKLVLNTNAITEMENNATNFFNSRKGDDIGEYVTAEMLKSIQYPTGGYTDFKYEPNYVENMVNIEKNNVVPSSLSYPGGLRIQKVTNYTAQNLFANATHYYYVKDFNPKTKTGIPSGILAFTPKYYWDTTLPDNEPTSSACSPNLKILTSGSTSQAYYNLDGSAYVGYSEVVESKENVNGKTEGYVINKYSNFGVGYFDDPPLATFQSDKVNNNIFMSPNTPFSSNSKKRGKLIEKDIYDKDKVLKEQSNYTYDIFNSNKVRNINMFMTPNEHGQHLNHSATSYPLGGSYLINIYNYLLSEKTELKKETSGTIQTTTNYLYNNENKVISEKETLKNNDLFEVKTKFMGDFFRNNYGTSDLYDGLNHNYMYILPVENVKLRNGKVIFAEIKNYNTLKKDGKDVYYLSDIYKLETNIPLSDYQYASIQGNTLGFDPRCKRKASFSTYNLNALPNYIETNSSKTVYLWSYNERYPIAEIKNATYQQIIDELGESYISDLAANSNPSDIDLSRLNALRSSSKLPNIQLTTFTFKPFIGMNSKTDPRGITTHYKYNDANQLESIKDLNNNILQQYLYHYSSQKQ